MKGWISGAVYLQMPKDTDGVAGSFAFGTDGDWTTALVGDTPDDPRATPGSVEVTTPFVRANREVLTPAKTEACVEVLMKRPDALLVLDWQLGAVVVAAIPVSA